MPAGLRADKIQIFINFPKKILQQRFALIDMSDVGGLLCIQRLPNDVILLLT